MSGFIGLAIASSAVVLFYFYIYLVLKAGGVVSLLKGLNAAEWILIFSACLFSVAASSILLQKNHFIYYWDYGMHWVPSVDLANLLFSSPVQALRYIASSIANSDYNATEPLLYALFVKVFGKDYSSVVKTVQVFFMCPAYICISLCINKYIMLAGYGKKSVPLYTAFAVLIPVIQNVLLKAYLDAPVLLVSTSLLILVSDFQYESFSLKKACLVAVGIMILVIFRRHFAYWTIGFIFMFGVLFLFQVKSNPKLVTRNFILSMAVIGGFCLLCFLFPFRAFLRHSLRNYSALYVAWNGTLGQKWMTVKESLGTLVLFAAVALPISIMKSKKTIRHILALLVLIFVPFCIMSKSVIMHDAHFYLGIVPILVILALGGNAFVLLWNKRIYKIASAALLTLYVCINYATYAFFWHFSNIHGKVFDFLFRQDRHYTVLYRSDIETIKLLVKRLNSLSDEYNEDVYIAAATDTLNSCILAWAYQPETFWSVSRMAPSSEVDLRDGFNVSFFDCGLVVVQEPTPDLEHNHYQKNCYAISWFISEQLRDKESPLGRHFQLVKRYDLENGQKGDVYRKVSDFELADYKFLIHFYDELYPENKEIFSERIKTYMKEHGYNLSKN